MQPLYLSPTRYFKLEVFMVKNHINARSPWKHNPNLIRNKFHNPSINKIAYISMYLHINLSIYIYIYIIAEAKRKWVPTIKAVLTRIQV